MREKITRAIAAGDITGPELLRAPFKVKPKHAVTASTVLGASTLLGASAMHLGTFYPMTGSAKSQPACGVLIQ